MTRVDYYGYSGKSMRDDFLATHYAQMGEFIPRKGDKIVMCGREWGINNIKVKIGTMESECSQGTLVADIAIAIYMS